MQTRKGTRKSISFKLIALVAASLAVTVLALVLNATRLFRKDNLNNIYVSSDLLTAAKASEVRAWLESLARKGEVLGQSLMAGGKSSIEGMDQFRKDREVLFAITYVQAGQDWDVKKSWLNSGLSHELSFTEEKFHKYLGSLKPPFAKFLAGVREVKSSALSTGQSVLLFALPLPRSSGHQAAGVLIGVRPDQLFKSFAETGPYTLALINDQGALIAHPDAERAKRSESLARIPIVQRMMTSELDREFQEYEVDGEHFMGAYAKLGFGGLGVLSQVPRSIAFETGDVLVRRSFLIAMMTFSLVFIMAYLFVQTIVSPMRRLKFAADQIALGNFRVRVNVSTQDELADLATSFNIMGREIERKIDNLSRINKASHSISSTLESQKLLDFSLDSLMELLGAKRAVAWIKDQSMKSVMAKRNWFEAGQVEIHDLTHQVALLKEPAQINVADKQFMVAPIRSQATHHEGDVEAPVSGYLLLSERDNQKEFDGEDLSMTGTLLTSIGSTLDNIRLLAETADKARMEKELETAKHVQDTMFPPKSIQLGAMEVESFYTPAAECGGDWWGCVPLSDNLMMLAIGDATGHGVPAAMVTATAKATCSTLHGLAKSNPEIATSPETIMRLLNKAVHDSTQGKILMTFFVAIVDMKKGTVKYTNASHDPIYWYKKPKGAKPGEPGSKDNLDALAVEPGPRLGQQADSTYRSATVQMNPGDYLLLYTDGLPEGKNPAGDEWGERKFMRAIVKNANESPAVIRDQLMSDYNEFSSGEPLADDITLVVCRYKG